MMEMGRMMKLLAIDSSSLVASVAVVTEDTVLAEYSLNYKKTHSQTLLPMIDEMTAMLELDLQEIDGIAVSAGPGSFTGLRIGSATAKGLGLALRKPLIPVPTIDAMAYQLYGVQGAICPIMDARRQQVYTGIYAYENGQFAVIEKQMAVSVQELAQKLNALGKPVTLLGDGVPVYGALLQNLLTTSCAFAPAFAARQRAGALGLLAVQYYRAGKIETADAHKPEYLRVSQAERERRERLAKEARQRESGGDSGGA